MNAPKAPLILAGQIYLNDFINEYLIVTRNNKGQIHYEGNGFKGQAEDQTFVERFLAVSPEDVEAEELQQLLSMCPPDTEALCGFVPD